MARTRTNCSAGSRASWSAIAHRFWMWLAGGCRRKMFGAWMNLDTFSTVCFLVSCWLHKDACLSYEEFVEVATRYMGLPSPSCEISAGKPCFGMRLSTATLPGDGWRVQHDSILWRPRIAGRWGSLFSPRSTDCSRLACLSLQLSSSGTLRCASATAWCRTSCAPCSGPPLRGEDAPLRPFHLPLGPGGALLRCEQTCRAASGRGRGQGQPSG